MLQVGCARSSYGFHILEALNCTGGGDARINPAVDVRVIARLPEPSPSSRAKATK
jgi:hypothetical protein